MLLETVGPEGPSVNTPIGANPSHTVSPLNVNNQSTIGNGASTGVGNSSGPVASAGQTTGMTQAAETNGSGLTLNQAVQQAVQNAGGRGISGDQLRNNIIAYLQQTQSQTGITNDQIQSVANNSGIVGSNQFTQDPTSAMRLGWVNQVLSAINLAPASTTPTTTTDPSLPTNNVTTVTTTDPTTVSDPGTRTTQPVSTNPNTDPTIGDPPQTTGPGPSGPTLTQPTTTDPTTNTVTTTDPTTGAATDPWAGLLTALAGNNSGTGTGAAAAPAAPSYPVATTDTTGTTSTGGSSSLLLIGVLVAGGGGLWYFMHKKHKDAQNASKAA